MKLDGSDKENSFHKPDTMFYSGNAQRQGGIGILLSANAKISVMEYKLISERIITLHLFSKFRKISIVHCYAPTEPYDNADQESFNQHLDSTLANIPKGDIVISNGQHECKSREKQYRSRKNNGNSRL